MTTAGTWCSSSCMKMFVSLFLALLAIALPAHAAMTNWTTVQGGGVRLIASGPLEDGHYLAGLEFSLEPGWHTYWRYPGEAGIPPQITLTDTANLKAYEVLYPIPERYSDGFSTSIVYHDGIVLPLRLIPDNPDLPVHVSMELFFGICKEVCVPGEASLTLNLEPDAKPDTLSAKLIARDMAAVPGLAPTGDLSILKVEKTATSGERLMIETRVGNGSEPDLFAAGPEGSYIGAPKLVEIRNNTAFWTLSTKGLKTTKSDQSLRLVLTSNGAAVEHLEPIQPDWVD